MTASSFQLPYQTVLNNVGVPVSGAQAFFYQSGTTTFQAVYTSSDLSVAHSQPVVADSFGRLPPVYLDQTLSYRVRITDASGVLIFDEDELNASLTIGEIGKTLYPQTVSEVAASVTPVSFQYPPGNLLRYGTNTEPGTTDLSSALQAAIDQQNQGGEPVVLPPQEIAHSATLDLYSGTSITGGGFQNTQLLYTGTGTAMRNASPGTRIFALRFADFNMLTTDGALGMDLDSVSSSTFDNILINVFDEGIKINAPTSGFAVYNRFTNVRCSNATTGFLIRGLSANANVFQSCRANVCTTGFDIEGSNENHINTSQIEGCTNGVIFGLGSASSTVRNFVVNNRFENNTTNITVGTGVQDTLLSGNYHVSGTAYSDSGTRTQIMDLFPNASDVPMIDIETPRESTDGAYRFVRTSHPSDFIPNLLVEDRASSGNPTALEARTTRPGGFLARFRQITSTDPDVYSDQFAILSNGRIRTNQTVADTDPLPTNAVAKMPIYNESGSLVGYIPIVADF